MWSNKNILQSDFYSSKFCQYLILEIKVCPKHKSLDLVCYKFIVIFNVKLIFNILTQIESGATYA